MEISLDAEELARLLIKFADDWTEALVFIENVAIDRGLDVDVDTVSSIIRKDYADGQ